MLSLNDHCLCSLCFCCCYPLIPGNFGCSLICLICYWFSYVVVVIVSSSFILYERSLRSDSIGQCFVCNLFNSMPTINISIHHNEIKCKKQKNSPDSSPNPKARSICVCKVESFLFLSRKCGGGGRGVRGVVSGGAYINYKIYI